MVSLHELNEKTIVPLIPRFTLDHHRAGCRVNTATFSYKSKPQTKSLAVDLLVATGGDDGQIILQTSAKGDLIQTFQTYSGKVRRRILI